MKATMTSLFARPRLTFVLLLLVPFGAFGGTAPGNIEKPAPLEDGLQRICDLGITYALSGQANAAESTFISLLSLSPGNPRAMNNLGNLSLWHGDPAVALAFYVKAAQADTTDAGILLNEATALMIAGDDSSARERAAQGIQRAGGAEQAASLLGIKYESQDADGNRSAQGGSVTREEVLALLQAATKSVPVDPNATSHRAQSATEAKAKKPLPAWRPAGARGAAETDLTVVVYWKR